MGPAFPILAGLLSFLAHSGFWKNTEALRCLHGWTLIGGFCYGYYAYPRSWPDAEIFCTSFNGAHLASIHSEDEMKKVANFILSKYRTNGNIWIGLTATETDPAKDWVSRRIWQWTDKSPVNYLSWNTLEPNNLFFNEFCGELYTYNLLYWNDNKCWKKFDHLCKMPAS